ncbi:MAG TPA: P-II family nitrogen regulator [Halanaerobiales bacterium]|nr:P-II family nitrogen regulator [Halanaerobiales bacterium]HPZ62161.1 P-II family nitrogen regulator [Halanaerobiales bacterium]HQD03833.1 P-II family nitrogen regulator [Halanaerobiales bacterium]
MKDMKDFELIVTVVDFGLGSKVIKTARESGISGGTIFLGTGTVDNRLLEILSLDHVRKEIAIMVTESSVAYEALDKLNEKFHFDKPNHGIAFIIPVSEVYGTRDSVSETIIKKDRGDENTMYKAIFTIVDRGKGENVMDAAKSAGAKGGTIINARGSGIHETEILFSMPIEPEKEVVMILAKNEIVDNISSAIREELKIDEPGMGIMFVLDVNKTYGLNE